MANRKSAPYFSMMWTGLAFWAALAMSPALAEQATVGVREQPSIEASAFAALESLSGRWVGIGTAKWGDSSTEKVFAPALGGHAVCLSGRTVYPAQERNPSGEVHDELTLFHLDRDRGHLQMTEYNNEGFVTRYRLDASASELPGKLVFVSESWANLPPNFRKARLTLRLAERDQLVEEFELDFDGKGLVHYLTMRLRRMGEATAADCRVR